MTESDLNRIRLECLELVKSKAKLSAGVAVIPIPLLDVVVDMGILVKLIPEINARFGLDVEQTSVYNGQTKTLDWDALKKQAVAMGSMLASRTAAKASFQGFFSKILAKQVSKFIPLGGQLVSAGLGYLVMKKIADAHVEECYQLAKERLMMPTS